MEEQINIVYFSGTGGTERAAKCFKTAFEEIGCEVILYKIKEAPENLEYENSLVLLIFPVYAGNAPRKVHEWIDSLPSVLSAAAAVISVSGGGEVSPNTACRASVIRKLTKKGFAVTYENMLVMPSNFFTSAGIPLSRLLLEVLPEKVKAAVSDIKSGKIRRTDPLIIDRLISGIAKLEHRGARTFGKKIRVGDSCTACGLCAENCPAGNITMSAGAPMFGNACNLCMGCIYGCPYKALEPGMLKFAALKNGFDLSTAENAPLPEKTDIDTLTKGFLWSGVRKYLVDKNCPEIK